MTGNELLRAFQDERDATVELLRKLVLLESPTTDKTLVDELVSFLAGHVSGCGLEPRIVPREDVGNIVWTEWGGGGGRRSWCSATWTRSGPGAVWTGCPFGSRREGFTGPGSTT